MDWVLNKFKWVMPDAMCNSGFDQSQEELPWSATPVNNSDFDSFQRVKVREYLADAPSSPSMSAADTMSRRSGNSSPPGSPGVSFSHEISSNRLSMRDIKRQMPREKKCEACDSICDGHATTCEICGEHLADIWSAAAKMRAEKFNREWLERPAELYVKEKMEPILWASKEFKFRSPNGGSRKIVVPVLAEGEWM